MIDIAATTEPRQSVDRNEETRLRLLWLLGGIGLLVFSAYGSIVPLHYEPHQLADAWRSLIASAARPGVAASRVDWGVNIMLLIPASFCLMAAVSPFRPTVRGQILRSAGVLASCFAFSVMIELAQHWFPPRVPSVFDIAAQWCGAFVGVAAFWVVGQWLNEVVARVSADDTTKNRVGLWLLFYVIGLIFFSMTPLDLSVRPADLAHKLRDGRISLIPFAARPDSISQFLYDFLTDICLFIPVGVFATTFLAQRNGTDRPAVHSLVLGAAIVLGIEVLQIIVLSRYADTTDLISGGIGIAIGVFAYHRLAEAPTSRARTANTQLWWLFLGILFYSFVLTVAFWYPFDFDLSNSDAARLRFDQFFGIPLARALRGNYLAALDGILRRFLLFLPLGGLVRLFVGQSNPTLRAVAAVAFALAVAMLAFAIELGQIFLPQRVASIDDAIICVVGATCGYFVTKLLWR